MGQVSQNGPRSSQERRSASLSRMKTPFLVPSSTSTFFAITLLPKLSSRDDHHPCHAKAVRDHAEPRGEEGFSERHLHLSAVGEGREHPVGLRRVGYRDRQRKTLKTRFPRAASV